jgi:hypothetical protein
MSQPLVTTNVTVRRYLLDTGRKASVRAVYSALFETPDILVHPLCRDIAETTLGAVSHKCKDAAAYTKWSMQISGGPLYDAHGAKRRLHITINSTVVLPKWAQRAVATPDNRAEIDRVLLNTAAHEAGHRSCPEDLAQAIVRFVNALPQSVDPRQVKAMNTGVDSIIHSFYYHQGRHIADAKKDVITRHGYIEGATYNTFPDKKGDPRDKYAQDARVVQHLVPRGTAAPQRK